MWVFFYPAKPYSALGLAGPTGPPFWAGSLASLCRSGSICPGFAWMRTARRVTFGLGRWCAILGRFDLVVVQRFYENAGLARVRSAMRHNFVLSFSGSALWASGLGKGLDGKAWTEPRPLV